MKHLFIRFEFKSAFELFNVCLCISLSATILIFDQIVKLFYVMSEFIRISITAAAFIRERHRWILCAGRFRFSSSVWIWSVQTQPQSLRCPYSMASIK